MTKLSLQDIGVFVTAIILAAIISVYTIRKVISITKRRKIFDIPDDIRKIHGHEIPSLGGIGIFIGYIIVSAYFWPVGNFMSFVLASSVILFFTGIYDDIMNMSPSKKLIAQLLASFLTVHFADIRIESLYGIAGINTLHYWPSIALTTICCTFFINVFNFIDGIDGLAGVLAVLYLSMLGWSFAGTGAHLPAGIVLSLTGATIGLLFYNIAPAKIYMGDTGSMFLGFSIFIFSILYVNRFGSAGFSGVNYCIHGQKQAMMLIISMLFLPVFDALRVFILRASIGISPLKADRTHLHYYLLDAGFGHSQSVLIIVSVNILLIGVAYFMQDANPLLTILCITLVAGAVSFGVYRLRQKNLAKGV